MKEPTSVITFGKELDPEPLWEMLRKFGYLFDDFLMIKINGKKVKRDYRIVSDGDIIALFKKEE